MSKFTDNLWRDLVREHGATLLEVDRPQRTRASRLGLAGRATLLRRPRVLAGGSLGLAGVATALVVALGGTAATAPAAFAVTRHSDGSVVVRLNSAFTVDNLPELNAELATMGTGEGVTIFRVRGQADSSSVTCTRGAGVSGPPVTLVVIPDGTQSSGAAFHFECSIISNSTTGAGDSGAG